jgi:hypothetical protein
MGTVKAALHYDDVVSTRGAAREADRGHRGFSPCIQDLRHLADFHIRAHQFGEPAFQHIGTAAAEANAVFQNIFHSRVHATIIVTQDRWSEGGVIIEVAIAIRVPQIRALGALESQFRLNPARKRHYTPGNIPTVMLEDLLRFRVGLFLCHHS